MRFDGISGGGLLPRGAGRRGWCRLWEGCRSTRIGVCGMISVLGGVGASVQLGVRGWREKGGEGGVHGRRTFTLLIRYEARCPRPKPTLHPPSNLRSRRRRRQFRDEPRDPRQGHPCPRSGRGGLGIEGSVPRVRRIITHNLPPLITRPFPMPRHDPHQFVSERDFFVLEGGEFGVFEEDAGVGLGFAWGRWEEGGGLGGVDGGRGADGAVEAVSAGFGFAEVF